MSRLIVAFLFALLLGTSARAANSPYAGHWEGELRRGEAVTPVRLHIGADDTVILDLPDLVYAGQTVPSEANGENLIATLPFGIGPMSLSRSDGRLEAVRGSFALILNRTPEPPFTVMRSTVAIEGAELPVEVYSPTGLIRPAGAVVISSGSGTADGRIAWSVTSWCDRFARLGLHCLVYPRRPDRNGEDVSTLRQDAADLVAVLAFLKIRSDVDATRLGVFASSRGVWIAAEAATLTPDIRFLLASGAAATTPADQEMISLVANMERAGRPTDQIADAIAYDRLYFHVAHTGLAWADLERLARRAETEPWGEFVDQPLRQDDLKWWGANGDFDPRLAYRALRIPALIYWGSEDVVSPPEIHMALLRALMRDNTDTTFVTFPGGDHRGEASLGDGPDGRWRWFGMAPGLLPTIDAWLVSHGIVEGAVL